MKYRVVWEHAPFARCKGEWKVFREYTEYDEQGNELILEEELSEFIPERSKPMNTRLSYATCAINKDGRVVWEGKTDGLYKEEWVRANKNWLKLIADKTDYSMLYDLFSEEDWRHNTCGCCI